MPTPLRILYCHCAYAQVVPPEVKQQVLAKLAEAGVAFDAVADLCELSAKRDPALAQLASGGPLRIAACFPRAVRSLFIAADAPLPEQGVEICNMRTESAERVIDALLNQSEVPANTIDETAKIEDSTTKARSHEESGAK